MIRVPRLTVRLPARWVGKLDSVRISDWLAEFLQSPVGLPPDPGAGSARVDLAIPPATADALAQIVGEGKGASLRRLFALKLDGAHATASQQTQNGRDGGGISVSSLLDPWSRLWEQLRGEKTAANGEAPAPGVPDGSTDMVEASMDGKLEGQTGSDSWGWVKGALVFLALLAAVAFLIWAAVKAFRQWKAPALPEFAAWVPA